LAANHPDDLVRYIHWASTAVLQSASSPKLDHRGDEPMGGVVIPTPPKPADDAAVPSATW
jgi:hypothetical protein